jgi:hypothetical protein
MSTDAGQALAINCLWVSASAMSEAEDALEALLRDGRCVSPPRSDAETLRAAASPPRPCPRCPNPHFNQRCRLCDGSNRNR